MESLQVLLDRSASMESLQMLLDRSAARHAHLCPRQVLGVRIGLLAGKVLDLDLPQVDKRLFAFVECDGCGMGGIAVASGCCVERRTLRVVDYGKLAAAFIDTQTGRAVRIHPLPGCREISAQLLPTNGNRWRTQLEAYQFLPDEQLFNVQPVTLTVSLKKIISEPGLRVICSDCGEEISNEREVYRDGRCMCRACAGEAYYEAYNKEAQLCKVESAQASRVCHDVVGLPSA
jgi:formylmethanofuran dehydrogenase subunit E